MAYSTKELIQAEIRGFAVNATGTVVTDDSLTEFIEQVDTYIDLKLKKKYQVPISEVDSPRAFSILKTISTYLVVCRVKRILETKVVDTKATAQDVKTPNYCAEGQAMLKEIVDGDLPLDDVPTTDAGGGVASYASSHCVKNKFKVDKDQW